MANFMDAWKLRPFWRKSHVHKICRFRGGYFGFWGGSADSIFMGARYFEANRQDLDCKRREILPRSFDLSSWLGAFSALSDAGCCSTIATLPNRYWP